MFIIWILFLKKNLLPSLYRVLVCHTGESLLWGEILGCPMDNKEGLSPEEVSGEDFLPTQKCHGRMGIKWHQVK